MTSALDGGGWSTPRPGCFTHGKDPVPIVQEAGWDPGAVWTGAGNPGRYSGWAHCDATRTASQTPWLGVLNIPWRYKRLGGASLDGRKSRDLRTFLNSSRRSLRARGFVQSKGTDSSHTTPHHLPTGRVLEQHITVLTQQWELKQDRRTTRS